MTTRQASACVLALLILCAAVGTVAQDRNGGESTIRCGAEWITFSLPGISEDDRRRMNPSVALANAPAATVHTIRKRNVRNVVLYTDTADGEVIFFLETGNLERPQAYYSGLVPLEIYEDLVKCLD